MLAIGSTGCGGQARGEGGEEGGGAAGGGAAFAARLAAIGAGPASTVVAYDASGGMYAARLWGMLRWVGHAAGEMGGMCRWIRLFICRWNT